jgi:HlyD family secretion protein
MTANCSFEIAQYRDILKIPNAALRFVPPTDPSTPATAAATQTKPRGEKRQPQSRVWVQGPAGLVAMMVTADATDGTWTRMAAGDLTEGQDVIVGMIYDGNDPTQTTNPFAPPFRGGQGGSRGMR